MPTELLPSWFGKIADCPNLCPTLLTYQELHVLEVRVSRQTSIKYNINQWNPIMVIIQS